MKKIKRNLILLSILPVLSIASCYKTDTNTDNTNNNCPECTKTTCPSCPTAKTINNGINNSLSVTYENGDEVSDTLNLLYDGETSTENNDGRTKKLKVSVTPSSATVSYTSSDTSVASVTSDGLITALKANSYCTITISSSNGLSRVFEVITHDVARFFGVSSSTITTVLDTEIENLTLPTGYTTVGADAINTLDRVKRLVISEGYTTINSTSPKRHQIPSSIEYMYLSSTVQALGTDNNVLPNLKTVEVDKDNTNYAVYDNKFLYGLGTNVTKNNKNKIIKGIGDFDGNVTDEMIEATGITGCRYFALGGSQNIKDLVIRPDVGISAYYTFCSTSVETISIPKTTISSFSARAFVNTPNLKEIKIYDDENNDAEITEAGDYFVQDGSLYINEDDTVKLVLGVSNGKIASTTTAIGDYAFNGRKFTSTKLQIPSSVTTIGNYVFMYTNLEKIYIPSSVTTFGSDSTLYTSTKESDLACYLSIAIYINGKAESSLDYDFVTTTAMSSMYSLFMRSNSNLHIYDGYESDRGSTARFTLQGRGYNRFQYDYNVTEETFAAVA